MTARATFSLVVLLAAGLSLSLSTARADSLGDIFQRGNAAYARGDYVSAIAEYETLLESGILDPSVSYNLAIAHGSRGQYGQAIRHFERVLLLAPGDEAAQRGLRTAREALGERQAKERGEAVVAERPALSHALFAWLGADSLAWVLLASTWLLSAALFALYFTHKEGVRLSLGVIASVCLVLSLVGGFGLWAKADFGAEGQRAIVVQDRAPLREGPDLAARQAHELAEGEGVRVLFRRRDFAHIRLPGGAEGFVEASAVGEI